MLFLLSITIVVIIMFNNFYNLNHALIKGLWHIN